MLSLRQPSRALFFNLIIPPVPSQLMHYPSKKNYTMFDFKATLFTFQSKHFVRSGAQYISWNYWVQQKGFTDKVNSMNSLTRIDEEITLFSRRQILPLTGPLRCFAAELMYIH